MIYPPNLRRGDTIGVFTPSYPLASKAFGATMLAVSHLEVSGYKVKLGKLIDKKDGYHSGSICDRAS